MPTLLEIELSGQLKRRDERINLLERQLEHETFRADKFEGALSAMRTSSASAYIDLHQQRERLKIANERIQELEKQRDELLDVIERAVRRLEIAHANGDTIMREWIIDARAAIAVVKGGA